MPMWCVSSICNNVIWSHKKHICFHFGAWLSFHLSILWKTNICKKINKIVMWRVKCKRNVFNVKFSGNEIFLGVDQISCWSQCTVTCKILLLPARQKLKREELRWNKTRHVATALWIINPAGHHHGNLVGFRGNVPSVMRALLVRTFPSMNLQMDRMVHTTPLMTETLYRKSSWGKRNRDTLSYWARRHAQGSSAVLYTTDEEEIKGGGGKSGV